MALNSGAAERLATRCGAVSSINTNAPDQRAANDLESCRGPVGAKEPFPEGPVADQVLHIHRELIHHLSEVCLLRDLYLHTKPATNGATR